MQKWPANRVQKHGQGTRHWLIVAIVVVALTMAAYINTLDGQFVFDDTPFLVDNPQLSEQHDAAYFFTGNVWSYSHNPEWHAPTRYRPLFFLSLWLINDVWPGSQFAMHAFSIFLHITAVLLLLCVLPRLLPGISPLAAGIAVCVFALHPVNSEAVAWISAFVHPMVTVFLLASFLLYDRSRSNRKLAMIAGSLLLFGLALLTNEMAIAYPVFIFLYEWIRGKKINVAPAIPFFIVLAIYLVIRTVVLGKAAPLVLSDLQNWLSLPAFLAEHLRHLVLPWPQPLYLGMPENWGLSITSALVALSLTALFLLLAGKKALERSGVLVAAAWVVAALIPPLVSIFSPQTVFVLRSLYLPSVGIAILVAWILHALPVLNHHIGRILVVAVLFLSFGTTVVANRFWHDDGRVYQRIIATNPQQFAGYLGLAQYLAKQGQVQDAINMYEKSISLAQSGSKAEPMMLLADLIAMNGQTAEAIRMYEDAIALANPKLKIELLMHLGLLLGESGDSYRSLDVFRQVTKLDPGRSSAWNGIGNNLWIQGRLEEAAEAYRKALNANPDNWQACNNLRRLLENMGKSEEAKRYLFCAEKQA